MSAIASTTGSVAALVRQMAEKHHVDYLPTPTDRLAGEITRLSGEAVQLDEIEHLLIALQRTGHISRERLIQLQAQHLHETARAV